MRGRAAFILVVLLGLTAGGAGCSDYPRHLDPARLALENPGPLQLFELYGQVYDFISVSSYEDAKLLLDAADEVEAPASTLKLLDQYNLLLGSVIGSLNGTEGGLAEASEHLRWLREALAEESLFASELLLEEANGTAAGLGSASRALAAALSYDPGVLLDGLDGLNRLVDELNVRILEGLGEVEVIRAARLEGLEETALEVGVSSAGPLVGSEVGVSGRLVDSVGAGVEGRAVGLLLEGVLVGEALTGPGGAFHYSLQVPYRYVESLGVRAEYWPVGGDRGLYAPSASGTAWFEPVYYSPVLSLEAPGVVYPVKSFQLKGAVSSLMQPLEGVAVSVRYLGSTHSAVSGADGGFAVTLFTPNAAVEGLAQVAASSLARGVLGPGSAVRVVQVARLPLEVSFEGPSVVFSGVGAVVSGRVTSGGAPLRGCAVSVRLGEEVYGDSTDGEGAFSLSLSTGVLAPSSRQVLEVAAAPVEPWVRAGAASSELLLVNSVVAVALPLMGLAAVLRRRTVEPVTVALGGQGPLTAPAAHPALPGLSGLYLRAAELVGRVTGTRLRPSDTVREYLGAVRPGLAGPVYSLFEWLSDIYERWFYGGRGEAPLGEAEDAVRRMRDQVEPGQG